MHTLLTLPMGCAIFPLKLIPQTVEAEITAVMPSQRACDAENQARYTLSNGPLRAQSNGFIIHPEYSATCGHTSFARDMLVSCQAHELYREFKVAPRIVKIIRP